MIESIDWVFPMCGDGIRTQKRGPFKPLIEIKGEVLFKHFINHLSRHIKQNHRIILILREDHNERFYAEKKLKELINQILPGIQVIAVIIKGRTSGPVETISNSISHLRDNSGIAIINPDQIVDFKWPKEIKNNEIYLPISFNNEGKSSYVIISNKGKITNIFEKEQKSFYASVGVYIFSSKNIIIQGLNNLSKKKNYHTNNEQYISHLINCVIDEKINCYPLETTMKYDLGNIECINFFETSKV